MIAPLLGIDRETLMIAALSSVSVAGVVVSASAWVLFLRERRAGRAAAPSNPDPEEPAGDGGEAGQASASA